MSDILNKDNRPSGGQSGGVWRKGKRYQGYDLDETIKKRSRRPWFWKVLGISLLVTALLMLCVCGYIFRNNQKMTNYISEINSANAMDTLLENYEKVLITESYSHLSEGEDYKTTRFVKKTKNGDYYSYYRTDGTEDDYREVIRNQQMYRYDGEYTYYIGLVGSDYEDVCVEQIEAAPFRADDGERIETQKESGDFIRVETVYDVTQGDTYNTMYGFEAGDQIDQTITLDKETMAVVTAVESCGGEEFHSYTAEFNGKDKNPEFYEEIKDADTDRECTVVYDYEGDDEKEYTFAIPSGVYFDLLEHEGYTAYLDEDCETEFTEYQMQVQNPESELTLYVKADES